MIELGWSSLFGRPISVAAVDAKGLVNENQCVEIIVWNIYRDWIYSN